jgi:RNA polymerase sigma-70 factor (ECF subfamily)
LEKTKQQQLVKSARNGDGESFGLLYEEYYAPMMWLAYSILLDRDLAEDAAQQAFVNACEKLAHLRDVDRFVPWLARICRNEAHQLIRQQRRQCPSEYAESGQVREHNCDDSQDDLVKTAIDQLPPMYREVVVLHYYNGMSYQDIQSVLGIAAHTVRGRLFRARKKIERQLNRHGFQKR